MAPDDKQSDDPLAGVYVTPLRVSPDPDAPPPGAYVQDIAPALAGYVPCGAPEVAAENAILCLYDTGHPERRGELRAKVYRTTAIVVICIRTDVATIKRGCDDVWSRVEVRTAMIPNAPRWND